MVKAKLIINFIYMDKKDVIIVDAYGVFNFGQGVSIPVLKEFQKWILAGKKVYILSNTTATNINTEKSYAKKGVTKGVDYTNLLTSGQFATEDIKANNLPIAGKKYFVFGTANFKSENPIPNVFEESNYQHVDNVEEADFIYCGIPQLTNHDGTKRDSVALSDFVSSVKELVVSGKTLLCVNPDKRANEGGRFVVRQGSIAELYEKLGGKVVYYGKPDPRIFEALINRYCPNVPKSRIVMIGDTCQTDILGAHLTGIDAILTIEGGITEYQMETSHMSLEEYLATLPEKAYPDQIWQRVSPKPLF